MSAGHGTAWRRRPASLVVALVAVHDGLDDVTVQFPLQESLRARPAEEKSKEVAKVKELEDDLVVRERRLQALAQLTTLEYAVVSWYVAKTKVTKRKGKRTTKKRRKRRRRRTSSCPGRRRWHRSGFLVSCSS